MKFVLIILSFIVLLFTPGEVNKMVRGHPDYGQSQKTIVIHSVTDMGELAARLGSPDVFQRSGNVIFMTDFEHGFSDLVKSEQGEGASIDLMDDRAYSGGISARLIGGEDDARRSILTKRFHTVETNQIGIESTFSLNEDCSYFSIAISVFDGNNKFVYQIFANIEEEEFQYYNKSGTKTWLADFEWGGNDLDHWHTMKLIIDLENERYARAFYNENIYELTDIETWSTTDKSSSHLDMFGWTLSQDGKNGIAYMDNLILTINEP